MTDTRSSAKGRKQAPRKPGMTKNCPQCGTPFWCIGSRISGPNESKYCSMDCVRASLRRDMVKCFWAKVDKDGAGGCWIWTGSRKPSGYGHFRAYKRDHNAHRYSYELAHGPIPKGLEIIHSCDVRWCVNPAHMRLGTHAENMADCKAKRRNTYGERGQSTLTEAQAREILGLRGKAKAKDLEPRYGVKAGAINAIWRASAWKHLQEQS